jgi:hypothetical protein
MSFGRPPSAILGVRHDHEAARENVGVCHGMFFRKPEQRPSDPVWKRPD